MIKKIYCFGTSHTKGAGFHLSKIKEIYKNIVDEPSMETCSWPGIMKSYLDTDIDVFNLAEAGGGNERIYRLVFDLISNPTFDKENTLLLIELSNLGRKELYSNTIDDYVICNYVSTHPPGSNFDVVWKYYQNDIILPKNVKKIYSDFLVETVNFDDVFKKLQMNILMFLNFLDSNSIKYELTVFEDDIISPNQKSSFNSKYKGIKYNFNNTDTPTWYFGDISENYLFEHETDNIIVDKHQGYWVNEITAKTIYNYLLDKKYILGHKKELKNKNKDFIEFKKKLNFGNFLI